MLSSCRGVQLKQRAAALQDSFWIAVSAADTMRRHEGGGTATAKRWKGIILGPAVSDGVADVARDGLSGLAVSEGGWWECLRGTATSEHFSEATKKGETNSSGGYAPAVGGRDWWSNFA